MSSLIGDMFTFPSSSGHPESTQPLGGNIKIAVHDSDTGSVCSSESTKMSSPDDDSESANSSTESDDFAKYCYDPDSSVIRFSSSSFAFDWPQLDDDFTEHEQLQQGEFQALPLDQQTQQQQQQQEVQQQQQQQDQEQQQQQQRTGQVKLTPLIEAARDGNIASLSQLLQEFNKAGSSLDLGQVQVQLSATDGTTALHHAAKTNHLEAVKLLLQHGSFIDETSNLGSTALHFAAANRNLEIVRYLASNGAHVDAKDKYGNTPLSLCLARQYLDVAADLLLFGASIDSKRHLDGRTPLHTACERGHLNVVKFLVENGAKVNQRDECKQTPLLVAICHGRVEVVKFLLSSSVKGIDLKVRDNDGRNIFHNLVLGNNGSGSGSRSSGSRSSKTDGNNNNNNNNNNNSQQQHQIEMLNAISLFCIPNPDLLNVLINEKDTTAHAETPLHLAVVAKNVPVVKRLLEMGADPNMQDRRGNTPLHLCRSAESGAADVSIAKILLKAGAQTEIKNNKGRKSFKQMLRSKLGIDMIGRRRSNSTESKKRSKEIDSAIASRNHKNEVRLLLLGPGESGKSTIAKQMNFLAQRQLSEWETAYYTFSIKKMCVLIMRSILAAAGSELNLELNTDTTTTTTTTIMQSLPSDDELTQSFIEENFSAKIGPLISRLWADPAVQAIYRQTCNKLTDSAKYFMDSIHRISAPEYIATQQDILRLRTKTTGVIETTFELEGVKFWITDVAGQRLHRKTWVPFFEDATAIFFVAGISEFDQTLAEDPTQNCLTEALELFGTITSEPLLRDKPIILFLNKKDIFQEKLQNGGKKLGDYLKDYRGDNTYNDAAKHIQRMFLDRARRPQPPPSPQQQQQQHLIPEESASMLPVSSPPSSGPRIYPFFTNATDASNISNVFDAARDIILAKTMNTSFFN